MMQLKKYLPLLVLISSFAEAKCKAILVNGGVNPFNNHKIHETQIKEMYKSLIKQGCKDEDIYVFSATGKTDGNDYRKDPVDPNPTYYSSGYKFNDGKQIKNLYAADPETLKTKIAEIAATFAPEDKALVYLNDHGGNTDGVKGLVPWTEKDEYFTAKDLDDALAKAPAATRVNVWADCCFCGTFNKVSRPNTCVATATDEYHVGDYFWSNWDEYSKQGAYTGPVVPTVNAFFAGRIRDNTKPVSLGQGSKSSQLPTNDSAFVEAGTVSKGCLIGPRNSSEQYIFNSLGFGDKQLCHSDLLKMIDYEPSVAPQCPVPGMTKEIQDMKDFLDSLLKLNPLLKPADKAKILALLSNIELVMKKITESNELKEIEVLNRNYLALPEAEKVEKALDFQQQVSALKERVLQNNNIFKLILDDQKLIMDMVFTAKSSPEQKQEYTRRRKCLDEPLF